MRIGSSNKFRWHRNKSQLLEILKHFDSANKTMSGWQQKQCCPIVIGLSAILDLRGSIRTCKRKRENLKRLSLVFGPDWKHGQTVQASLSTGPAQLLTPVLTLLWPFCKSPDSLYKRWAGWSGPLATCGWAVQVLKSDRESRKAATTAPLLWIALSAVSVSLPHTQVSISKINSHLRCLLSLATCYSPLMGDSRQDYFKQIRWKAENINLCTTYITRSSSFEDILRDSRENMNIWQSPLLFVYFSTLPLKNSSREAFSQTNNTLPANMRGSSTYGGILQGRKKNTRDTDRHCFRLRNISRHQKSHSPMKRFPFASDQEYSG